MRPDIKAKTLQDSITDRKRSRSGRVDIRVTTNGQLLGPNPNRSALMVMLMSADNVASGTAVATLGFGETPTLHLGPTIVCSQLFDAGSATNIQYPVAPLVLNRTWFGDDLMGAIQYIGSAPTLTSVWLIWTEITHMMEVME